MIAMSISPNGIPTPIPIAIDFVEEVEPSDSCVALGDAVVDWAVRLGALSVEGDACTVEVVPTDDDVLVDVVAVEEASRVLIAISIVALP